jgi:hypothetical protein
LKIKPESGALLLLLSLVGRLLLIGLHPAPIFHNLNGFRPYRFYSMGLCFPGPLYEYLESIHPKPPEFIGQFLPTDRSIDATGVRAKWQLLCRC